MRSLIWLYQLGNLDEQHPQNQEITGLWQRNQTRNDAQCNIEKIKQAVYIWGFISIFDLRHGRSTRRLVFQVGGIQAEKFWVRVWTTLWKQDNCKTFCLTFIHSLYILVPEVCGLQPKLMSLGSPPVCNNELLFNSLSFWFSFLKSWFLQACNTKHSKLRWPIKSTNKFWFKTSTSTNMSNFQLEPYGFNSHWLWAPLHFPGSGIISNYLENKGHTKKKSEKSGFVQL